MKQISYEVNIKAVIRLILSPWVTSECRHSQLGGGSVSCVLCGFISDVFSSMEHGTTRVIKVSSIIT